MKSVLKSAGAAALLGLSLLCVASPAQADGNWMRDYVKSRVAAMNARAAGEPIRLEDPGLLIVGGTVAPDNVHRFQVALLFKSEPDNYQAQFCGGTLVKPNYVVTAAHCSDFVTAGEVQVLTGTQDLNGTGVRRNVTRISIHPNWNPNTFDSDVAVWKLATKATNIPLATLTNGDAPVRTSVKVTGWGALAEGGGFPIDLRQVNVPVVATSNCNGKNSYNGAITTRMFCAGLNAGGKDSCQGDSGGPLTQDKGSGYKVLTGIVSFGTGCARPNLYGVYTRIAHPAIKNFIVNRISQ